MSNKNFVRKPFIAGNWKMNLSLEEAISLTQGLVNNLKNNFDVDIVLAPSFPYLSYVYEIIKNYKNFSLSAQNMFYEINGAFTGEVSPLMLKEVGCSYVIIGHSERRTYFKEDNDFLNKKIIKALENDLYPIYCIGETLEQRENNKTFDIVSKQLEEGLKNISEKDILNIVIAYEPVWAIGTGKTATNEQAEEVHLFIREHFKSKYSLDLSQKIKILYGGSVNEKNASSLMYMPNIDGLLVGGASLKLDVFTKIVNFK